jgi:hypothetical protein
MLPGYVRVLWTSWSSGTFILGDVYIDPAKGNRKKRKNAAAV